MAIQGYFYFYRTEKFANFGVIINSSMNLCQFTILKLKNNLKYFSDLIVAYL